MLLITVPDNEPCEYFDDEKEEFIYIPAKKEQTLRLEHSLISLSKWESKWNKPFYSKEEKSIEETIDYIRCMTLNRNIKLDVYSRLTDDNLKAISEYIYAPMTATTFPNENAKSFDREIITSELIYYWMIAQNIPFKCEKWHLNRLITLIRVCGIKNTPPKKMSRSEIMNRNASLNAARREKLNTKG